MAMSALIASCDRVAHRGSSLHGPCLQQGLRQKLQLRKQVQPTHGKWGKWWGWGAGAAPEVSLSQPTANITAHHHWHELHRLQSNIVLRAVTDENVNSMLKLLFKQIQCTSRPRPQRQIYR